MAAERRTVEVVADWAGLGGPVRMGLLHATPSRGKEIFSFEYAEVWLASKHALLLDPSLRLHQGHQHAPVGRDNFGVFLDSSPDRWGRVLMQRREAQLAREDRRRERSLLELDYLLGVYDGHRLGALRFRRDGGPFLDDNTELASPPWTSLRELEQASLHLERDGAERDPRYSKWLRMLIAPGRSLGGARPKASVLDMKKRLWIAKFPSANDNIDVGAWESVVNALAKKAGIVVADGKRGLFGKKHHTFLTRRFDRTDDGERIHFSSAMTMLERTDGEDGASYIDLAGVITQHGAHAQSDLEQLWRRIVFFVCISNVDDHLRNHGFLLEKKGWSLAPAYDMNPVAHGDGLSLNISETDNAQDLALVLDVARHFRVKAAAAKSIMSDVIKLFAVGAPRRRGRASRAPNKTGWPTRFAWATRVRWRAKPRRRRRHGLADARCPLHFSRHPPVAGIVRAGLMSQRVASVITGRSIAVMPRESRARCVQLTPR